MATIEQVLAKVKRGRQTLPLHSRALHVFVGWAIVLVLATLTLNPALLFLATTTVIYVLFAMSTNIMFGWTGMVTLGQAAFFGTGAYIVALFADEALPPLVQLLFAALVAGILGLLFALISVRVVQVQFAMLTLVLGQVLWLLVYKIPALKGENGIPGLPRGTLLGVSLYDDKAQWAYTVLIVAICTYFLTRVSESSLGAAMNATRDDPVRAAATGINVRVVRIIALTMAGALGGLAGALFAQQQGIVSPDVLTWILSGDVIVMCVIGGHHSFWGPAIGAVIFTVLTWFVFDVGETPNLYIGLVLVLLVLFWPEGLTGGLNALRNRLGRRVERDASTS